MSSPEATVELRYGRGGDVIRRTRVTLSERDATGDRLVTWYHAAQQVAELSVFPSRNADALLALGRAHGLLTPQTSFLVLDTIEQHLQHDIEPARSRVKMHKEWLKLKKQKTHKEGLATARQIKTLLRLWKGKKEWYAKDINIKAVMQRSKKKNKPGGRQHSSDYHDYYDHSESSHSSSSSDSSHSYYSSSYYSSAYYAYYSSSHSAGQS